MLEHEINIEDINQMLGIVEIEYVGKESYEIERRQDNKATNLKKEKLKRIRSYISSCKHP